jgi:hypothetical protein
MSHGPRGSRIWLISKSFSFFVGLLEQEQRQYMAAEINADLQSEIQRNIESILPHCDTDTLVQVEQPIEQSPMAEKEQPMEQKSRVEKAQPMKKKRTIPDPSEGEQLRRLKRVRKCRK